MSAREMMDPREVFSPLDDPDLDFHTWMQLVDDRDDAIERANRELQEVASV